VSAGIWILIIILALIVIVVIGLVLAYNRFVSQRQLIRNAWSNIETELKRRYDLIPNLVSTVQGYAAHEREIFEEVARARAAAGSAQGPAQAAAAEGPLTAALGRLFAVAENYPDLKASTNFLALQQELSNTEDRIQAARRFYNSNVEQYNARVNAFPSNFIARRYHFTEEPFFDIPEDQRAVVEAAPRVDFSGMSDAPSVGASIPAAPPAPASPPPGPPADLPPPPAAPDPPAPPPPGPPANPDEGPVP
jgi:LemA protein